MVAVSIPIWEKSYISWSRSEINCDALLTSVENGVFLVILSNANLNMMLKKIKYGLTLKERMHFIFFLVTRQSAALNSVSQHAMPSKFSGNWRRNGVNGNEMSYHQVPMFPLPYTE